MRRIDFFPRLLAHAFGATATFAIVTIVMEALMPGSVLPYLNPIPFAIVGSIGLAAVVSVDCDRTQGSARASAWIGRLLIAFSFSLVLLAFAGFAFEMGRTGMAACVWFALALGAIAAAAWPKTR